MSMSQHLLLEYLSKSIKSKTRKHGKYKSDHTTKSNNPTTQMQTTTSPHATSWPTLCQCASPHNTSRRLCACRTSSRHPQFAVTRRTTHLPPNSLETSSLASMQQEVCRPLCRSRASLRRGLHPAPQLLKPTSPTSCHRPGLSFLQP